MYRAIAIDCDFLKYVHVDLLDDKQLVLAAVRQSPSALKYAEQEFWSDADVEAAVREGGFPCAHEARGLGPVEMPGSRTRDCVIARDGSHETQAFSKALAVYYRFSFQFPLPVSSHSVVPPCRPEPQQQTAPSHPAISRALAACSICFLVLLPELLSQPSSGSTLTSTTNCSLLPCVLKSPGGMLSNKFLVLTLAWATIPVAQNTGPARTQGQTVPFRHLF